MQARFELERETKNTVLFAEASDTPMIGRLYVQKSAHAELGSPATITVTVEAAS